MAAEEIYLTDFQETDEIVNGFFIVLTTPQGDYKIDYENFLIDEDHITFSTRLDDFDTNIVALSSTTQTLTLCADELFVRTNALTGRTVALTSSAADLYNRTSLVGNLTALPTGYLYNTYTVGVSSHRLIPVTDIIGILPVSSGGTGTSTAFTFASGDIVIPSVGAGIMLRHGLSADGGAIPPSWVDGWLVCQSPEYNWAADDQIDIRGAITMESQDDVPSFVIWSNTTHIGVIRTYSVNPTNQIGIPDKSTGIVSPSDGTNWLIKIHAGV